MIFTDRQNYTYGGEIPKMLSKALYSNENSMSKFSGFTSYEKKDFIDNFKGIRSFPEAKNYVDTMGESHRLNYELKTNYFK